MPLGHNRHKRDREQRELNSLCQENKNEVHNKNCRDYKNAVKNCNKKQECIRLAQKKYQSKLNPFHRTTGPTGRSAGKRYYLTK